MVGNRKELGSSPQFGHRRRASYLDFSLAHLSTGNGSGAINCELDCDNCSPQASKPATPTGEQSFCDIPSTSTSKSTRYSEHPEEEKSIPINVQKKVNYLSKVSKQLLKGYKLFNYSHSSSMATTLAISIQFIILSSIACNFSQSLVINFSIPPQHSNRSANENRSNDHESTLVDFDIDNELKEKRNSTSNMSAKLLEVDALGYLQRYGYMNGTFGTANLISEDSFHDAVMNFQRFAGIPETGTIDSQTVKYMRMPRCGNKDRSGKGENRNRRRKRYALQGSKWRRQELTYRISQYPTRFSHKKHEVDHQIEKAFKIWSQVAPIDFVVKKEGRVHIDIRFANGEHGDGDPFDGPGNTLAHAYFPQYGGDAHFDDQEYWTVDSYAGTNIFQVAAHELGHSLGLGHSSVREALMAPFYQKYKPNFKLHADDILGIQALYGERSDDQPSVSTSTTSSTSTTTTTTTESSDIDTSRRRTNRPSSDGNEDDDDKFFNSFGSSRPVDLCQDSAIDTITRTEDGNTYVFRGQFYWQINNEGLASGFPAKISRDWDGLPGNLDAALTWSDGKTFFFKGDKYWRFFNKRREAGYPKQISAGFAGIPNNIDTAFVWGGNGKTYFFKKDKYWRFDSKQDPPVSSQYPKSIKNWGGLPTSGIDAAFKWENGMTYFFKDDVYYRFDDREFEVDSSARPTFPRSTAEWWYGCTNSNLPLKKKSKSEEESLDSDASGTPVSRVTPNSGGSLLALNRKPYLLYDNFHSSTTAKPKSSTSLLGSLSSLFSSSGSSGSLSSINQADDWSFHHGIGEEVQKNLKKEKSLPKDNDKESFGRHRDRSSLPDNTRWMIPTNSGSRREQSLSELRMEPGESNR